MMKKTILMILRLCVILSSCKKSAEINSADLKNGFNPGKANKSFSVSATAKAPLYWNPYVYNIVHDSYVPENEWQANIDWVNTNLKSYGYNMECIDGWGDDGSYNADGYRTKHASQWAHDYAYWSGYLQQRGMTLGMYNNPLWVNKAAADAGVKVKGTTIPLSGLVNNR